MRTNVISISRFLLLLAAAAGLAGSLSAQKEMAIAAVQGPGETSPFVGQTVKVKGIVTARTRTGFFIQTPDDKADGDPLTSEGIFVYTRERPAADAAIGNEVSVSGRVEEFRPRADADALPITEISADRDGVSLIGPSRPLPAPVILTLKDTSANIPGEWERFEGMRVAIETATVVGATGGRLDAINETIRSDGIFFAVVKGTPRPFREPGIDIRTVTPGSQAAQWKKDIPRLSVFDSNPEVLRIDTSEQEGSSPIDVTAKVEITGITGVMHFGYGRYTILTDASRRPSPASAIRPVPMPDPPAGQFVIASSNIESFFDDRDAPGIKEDILTPAAFDRRLSKISMVVRDYLKMPDILATVEIEDINALKRLADRINSDAVKAGKADPKYQAILFEGNDGRGIDNGFLVKTTTVTVVSAKQIGKDEKFRNPVTGNDDMLNDRTPIVLEAVVKDAAGAAAFPVTVVVNHLKSYRGVDDPKDGPNVRMKKKLQAEYLAKWVNARQKASPTERILLVGDFNAFQFSDGLVDVIGTISGTPAPKDTVVLSSEDLVDTDLTDLVNIIRADQQYSYVYDGNAQVLDHFLVSAEMRKYVAGFGYLRINADFPQVFRADGSRPERFSDHDVAVGYFRFDAAK